MSTVPVYGRWHCLPPAAGVIDEEALSGCVSIFEVHCKNKITREFLIYPSVNKIMSLPPTLVLFCATFPGLLYSFLDKTLVSSHIILILSWKSSICFPDVWWSTFSYKLFLLIFPVFIFLPVMTSSAGNTCRQGDWNCHLHLILLSWSLSFNVLINFRTSEKPRTSQNPTCSTCTRTRDTLVIFHIKSLTWVPYATIHFMHTYIGLCICNN